jgi:hypothetical protein
MDGNAFALGAITGIVVSIAMDGHDNFLWSWYLREVRRQHIRREESAKAEKKITERIKNEVD